uniref:E3 ubiquitin protein ligase n=1 Tax=Strigamia maritima TaxID=126957 RepID=T1ILJ5_STRMM
MEILMRKWTLRCCNFKIRSWRSGGAAVEGEGELRQRIEQLEKRQTQDDAVLCVVNRYWNQLNEDIRVLLQRFDAETSDESENKSK